VTLQDIHADSSTVNGIAAWSEKGIVGRGILLDYEAWREAHNHPSKDAFKSNTITLAELKAVADWEGVTIKFGDILIVRSGMCYKQRSLYFSNQCGKWLVNLKKKLMTENIGKPGYMAQYNTRPHSDLEALSKIMPPTFLGIEQSTEMLHWIWDNFSAVAGDQPSFECWRMYLLPSFDPYFFSFFP
jgi:hypothetical protein